MNKLTLKDFIISTLIIVWQVAGCFYIFAPAMDALPNSILSSIFIGLPLFALLFIGVPMLISGIELKKG